jgi:raffinose/stachyose/melibiose transport system substrate-binding protein
MAGSSRRAFLQRSLALGIGAPSLAAVLAACTGDEGTRAGNAPVPARPAGATRRHTGQIVVATLDDPPQQAKQALARAYRKHQPGVQIVWETRTTTPTAYASWLSSQLGQASVGPDIVSGNSAPLFRGFVDLDEYRAQVNPYTGRPWEDDYNFGLYRELNTVGERTVIGTDGARPFWYYNKDIFGQVGIEPPTTWSALVSACAKLRAARQVPIATTFGEVLPEWFASIYFDQYHDEWVEKVRAQPGDWNWDPELDDGFEFDSSNPLLHASYTFSPQRFYKALKDKDKTVRFDTPAVAEVIANLTRVFPRYALDDFFLATERYTPFLLGKTAMMVDGAWSLSALHQDLQAISPQRGTQLGIDENQVKPFEWDVFAFPEMRSPLVQSEVRQPEGTAGTYLCAVKKGPAHTEMVMDFLMFWMSKPGFAAFVQGQADAGQLMPMGPSMVRGVQYPTDIQNLLAKLDQKGVVGPAYGTFWANGAGGATTQGFRSLFISALQGRIDSLEYATQLQKHVQRNLDDLLKAAGLTEADIANPARRPSLV